MENQVLKENAKEIRKTILKSIFNAGSGHPGGSLSATDIITYLYFEEMNVDPQNPKLEGRDKFILSKGHGAPALYSALAQRGFFFKEDVHNLRKIGGKFQGHPDKNKVPGVEMSTGSLGQGFSASIGFALASKLDNSKSRTYVLLGDGELQEGIVWEAAMAASHYELSNLTAVVDWNGLQIDGKNEDVMNVTPIAEKFASFGWNVVNVDGHDFEEIRDGFNRTKESTKPTLIVAKTVKGKGVSFMENQAGWHGKAPKEDELNKALAEIEGGF